MEGVDRAVNSGQVSCSGQVRGFVREKRKKIERASICGERSSRRATADPSLRLSMIALQSRVPSCSAQNDKAWMMTIVLLGYADSGFVDGAGAVRGEEIGDDGSNHG